MSALDNTPTNKNFLSPLNFNFHLQRAPHLNFFAQSAIVPGMSFMSPLQGDPFTNIPLSGDRIHFEDLTVTFKVDEELQNYLEIANWIRGLGFPETFTEYSQLKAIPKSTGNGLASDIILFISKGSKMANFQVTFKDAFPVALSRLEFQTTDTSVDYITATATFKYVYYNIEKL